MMTGPQSLSPGRILCCSLELNMKMTPTQTPQPSQATGQEPQLSQGGIPQHADLFAAVASVIITLIISAYLGFMSLLSGVSASFDPNDLHDLQDWTTSIAHTAQSSNEAVAYTSLFLAITLSLTAVAAWCRNKTWVVTGALNGAIFAFTLIFAIGGGASNLSSVVTKTHERIGNVTLIEPAESATNDPSAREQPELLQADAEAAVRHLITTIETAAGVPPMWQEPGTQKPTQFTGESIPLVAESCAPVPENRVGTRFNINLTMASTSDGTRARDIELAINESGYETVDQMRDRVFMGSPDLPLAEITVNDSYTIDGDLSIAITTNCVNADSTQPSDATP